MGEHITDIIAVLFCIFMVYAINVIKEPSEKYKNLKR